MLSEDLRSLKVWFDCTLDGCELNYENALAFSRNLEDAIAQAEQLEQNGAPLLAFAAAGGPIAGRVSGERRAGRARRRQRRRLPPARAAVRRR
ncbi:MAG: hypothetical protein WD871_01655 [Xanthobacteraceae bacterium]